MGRGAYAWAPHLPEIFAKFYRARGLKVEDALISAAGIMLRSAVQAIGKEHIRFRLSLRSP